MIRRVGALGICLLLASLGAASLAPAAVAGGYDVIACFGAVNHSWQPYSSDGAVTTFVECPGGESVNGRLTEGMAARNTIGSGFAPAWSNAKLFFDAPPGTRIVRVTGQINQNSTGGWAAGIWDDGVGRWLWCGTGCVSTFGTWPDFDIGGLSTSRISALVMCSRATCPRDGLYGLAALRKVTVTVGEYVAPSVAVKPSGLVVGWRGGVQPVEVDAMDPVGIRTLIFTVDDQEVVRVTRDCDYTYAIPCPSGTSSPSFDTRAFQDGRHRLRIIAADAAGNQRAVERTVAIDNHAPAGPLGLSVDDGTGWRSRDSFSLRWRLPGELAAPLARAWVELCPLRRTAGSACVPPRSLSPVTSALVRVPQAGEWRARVWLEDAAGNAAPSNAAEAILRADYTPPVLALKRPTPEHPALVRVAASDDRSGVGTREIMVRRRHSSFWISLPVTVQPGGFSAFVDDEQLPHGIYELRARAVDRAGNERSTDRLSDGKRAELVLPLRISTTLRVGRPTRVRARGADGKRRYRIKIVTSPRTRYGLTIPLRGRLTSPGGNPLAGREVHVLERTKLGAMPWRLIATVQTSRTGRFTFKALRGPSRTLRFRFSGSDTIRGQTATVRLGVRAGSTMGVSRHHVVNGDDVTFRGRLRGRPLPNPGKLIELQAYARGRWLTFATTRAGARTGRWSYRYRFSATRGNVRYRFRARVPKEASYPYETGVSRRVTVSVLGL